MIVPASNNIVILTPIAVEYNAVRKHLCNLTEKIIGGNNYGIGSFVGKHQIYTIILHQTGSKNSAIALATEKAIQAFDPMMVLVVGIAGGVKDVSIGDVVVGTKAYGYEAGKETATGFVARPEVVNYSKELLAIAMNIANRRTAGQTNVFFGPIASGDKVIATTDAEIYPLLKKYYNDTIALEMEAIGFGQAMLFHPHIRFLNIRGISDLLDNKSKTDATGSQELAVNNAAAFAFELLNEIDISQFKISSMDVKTIAGKVVEMLLPHLKKSKSISKISSEISEATDTTISAIWKKIKPIFIEEFEEEKDVLSESVGEKPVLTHVLQKALKKDNQMREELEAYLNILASEKVKEKHVLTNVKVRAKEGIRIGDETVGDDSHWDRKNIIEGGEFETEGDFRLGDG